MTRSAPEVMAWLKGVPFKSRLEMEESRTALAAISHARRLKQTSTSQFCISFQVKFITYGGKESLEDSKRTPRYLSLRQAQFST